MNTQPQPISQLPAYFSDSSISLEPFEAVCSRQAAIADYPHAEAIEQNIPIYRGDTIRDALSDPEEEVKLKAELCLCLKNGPGVYAVQDAYPDTTIIDRMTTIFREIVAEEKASGQGQGDHFGSNERIWNSIQKTCVKDPDLFIDYYGNPILAVACEAWLGPFYQISAQLNNVKPGSQAQSVHRDYHLGFQSTEVVARFPAHAQVMSQYLTLQGAIVHSEMPIESGPTLLLPFSHHFEAGYLAYMKPEFMAYFEQHKVQLPFSKGDALFFSPALFHGAGTNHSDNDRIANLIQISSAFGRTMETINNTQMVEAVYPALFARLEDDSISNRQLKDTIAAAASGYSFPTNLDSDPPVGGNAPETGQQLMLRALSEKWSLGAFMTAMAAYSKRREA